MDQPNLLDPITQPIWVDGWKPFWLVTQVPAGTPNGPYTLFVTATSVLSPEVFAPASDLMWVGAWVAPPPPPPPAYPVYLPVVLRESN